MTVKFATALRGLVVCVALFAGAMATPSARAAFHLWQINEIYTNNTGSLQFIELRDTSGNQNFVGGQGIDVTNLANTITHSFTLPIGSLPGSTLNHSLLFATAGLQAAGGPAPDYIIPDGFLFSAGGTINFFGQNSGPYTALPTDGFMSRNWNAGTNGLNSPTNYAGQTGSVPNPGVLALAAAGGVLGLGSRRRR
jgi:hypothetical protein